MSPRAWLTQSPLFARVAPFVLFVVLTSCPGQLGEGSRFWIYGLKTLLGAWMVWSVRSVVTEMRWKFSLDAVLMGFAVFALWVGLDSLYPKSGSVDHPWNPLAYFKDNPSLAWAFIACRILGSTLIVPPLEEVFYRSFLYRYIQSSDFLSIPLGNRNTKALGITALVFGFAHFEWLAGILCALGYQFLVIRKARLGDAMTAHAITNLLLGLWVVYKGAWHFW